MRKALVVYRFKPVDSTWGHGNIEVTFGGPLTTTKIRGFGDNALKTVNEALLEQSRLACHRSAFVVTNVIMLEE